MTASKSFLTELEDAVSRGTAESCLQALWHATDILIAGRYSEEQIWTFGEIIGRLAEDIEIAARVRLANKLAPSDNAPVPSTSNRRAANCRSAPTVSAADIQGAATTMPPTQGARTPKVVATTVGISER